MGNIIAFHPDYSVASVDVKETFFYYSLNGLCDLTCLNEDESKRVFYASFIIAFDFTFNWLDHSDLELRNILKIDRVKLKIG